MKNQFAYRWMLTAAVLWMVGLTASGLSAAEPFREFLDGLRANRYYDQALEYLDNMEKSSLISDEQKQTLLYEKGVTLVDQAAVMRGAADRERRLDQAAKYFQDFVKAHPNHRLVTAANNQLANVLVERARALVTQAKQPSAQDKDKLLAQARDYLKQSETVFTAAMETFQAEFDAFKKNPPKNEAENEARREAYSNILKSELLAATVAFEVAETYPEGSKESKDHLEKAAARYAEIYKKRGKRMAGFYARMYEGRCYQKAGDGNKALGVYTDLMDQVGDSDEFRGLKAETMKMALEIWNQQKKYPEAIKAAQEFVNGARGQENEDPTWVAMKYLLANALLEQSNKIKEKEDKEGKKKDYVKQAATLANEVVRIRGGYQEEARDLLAKMGKAADEGEPKTFEEAFDKAKTALDMKQLTGGKLAAAKDPAEIAKLKEQVQQARDEAMKYMRLALELKGSETPVEQINQARYILCYLHYDGGNYWDAAVMGDFLARTQAKSPIAPQCSTIALAAYRMLYQQQAQELKTSGLSEAEVEARLNESFESDQVARMSEYIAGAWPNTDVADNALNVLILIAIKRNETDKINEYLERINPNSPRKAEAQVMVGQALWSSYVSASQLPQEQRPPQDQLDGLVKQAEDTLRRGIDGMLQQAEKSKAAVPPQLVFASLSLSQILTDSSQPEKAIAVLEDPKVGPLTLLKNDHAATKKEGYDAAAYLAGLRAYISVDPPQFDKAMAIMDSLERSVANDPKEGEKLILRLMAMGQSIEKQLEMLRQSNDQKKINSVSKGFDGFLTAIANKETGNTFNSLNWVASSYQGLAAGLTGNSSVVSPEAKEYFAKAVNAYKLALPKASDASQAMAVRIRMAELYRKMRDYDAAIDMLAEVLKEKPTMITAQIEAAKTLAERAQLRNEPDYFNQAIDGDQRRSIWGWGKIAAMTARNEKFRDIYHEARLNLASARYELAKAKNNDKSLLEKAKRDIYITRTLYPELGGEPYMGRYNELLMKIQKDLNEEPIGLQEFQRAETAPKVGST